MQNQIKSVKITTYKNAVKNGFNFQKFAADWKEFANVAIEPKANALSLEYVLYTCDDDSAEGEEVIAKGSRMDDTEFLDLVVAKCTCGCSFGDVLCQDDLSALSVVHCPDCGTEASADEYCLDDSLSFNRVIKSCK